MWIASSHSTISWRRGEPVTEHSVAADITVVIPTVGRALLEGCLDSIAAGTVWPGEIVVVDQSRTDLIVPWVERLQLAGLSVTHLRSDESGIAAATNRGLERVPTPYVATAYSLRGRTASGLPVSKGIIAADPRVLPLGSRVKIEAGPYSGEYLVADTGGLVRGKRIDIWTPSSREAMRFGRRTVKLTVLSLGGKKKPARTL